MNSKSMIPIPVALLVIGTFACVLVFRWSTGRTASKGPAGTATSKPKPPELSVVRIEPGTFMIGDPDNGDAGTRTDDYAHQVTLTKAFLIGKYTVTVAQFSEFIA